eukprot:CAMPEP_0170105740 /NCGR_PEP_ID=MMETSP0020_2-20130122/4957_1 /TAXON_ID=98059 /ORGANISM="Dinobryon sp., Strain UTEXLB2267" /LENGTH=576 /DNA_ID=CAMNT_0010329931 /DNA_START=155 /DNA_END=1885 /DNA_ORIENTATION=+
MRDDKATTLTVEPHASSADVGASHQFAHYGTSPPINSNCRSECRIQCMWQTGNPHQGLLQADLQWPNNRSFSATLTAGSADKGDISCSSKEHSTPPIKLFESRTLSNVRHHVWKASVSTSVHTPMQIDYHNPDVVSALLHTKTYNQLMWKPRINKWPLVVTGTEQPPRYFLTLCRSVPTRSSSILIRIFKRTPTSWPTVATSRPNVSVQTPDSVIPKDSARLSTFAAINNRLYPYNHLHAISPPSKLVPTTKSPTTSRNVQDATSLLHTQQPPGVNEPQPLHWRCLHFYWTLWVKHEGNLELSTTNLPESDSYAEYYLVIVAFNWHQHASQSLTSTTYSRGTAKRSRVKPFLIVQLSRYSHTLFTTKINSSSWPAPSLVNAISPHYRASILIAFERYTSLSAVAMITSHVSNNSHDNVVSMCRDSLCIQARRRQLIMTTTSQHVSTVTIFENSPPCTKLAHLELNTNIFATSTIDGWIQANSRMNSTGALSTSHHESFGRPSHSLPLLRFPTLSSDHLHAIATLGIHTTTITIFELCERNLPNHPLTIGAYYSMAVLAYALHPTLHHRLCTKQRIK